MANSAPRQSSEGRASPLLISLHRHHLPRGSLCQPQPNSGPSGFFTHRTEISHPGSIPQLEASVICPGWACLFHPPPPHTPAPATKYVHINHKGFGRCAITTEKNKERREEGSMDIQRKASAGSGLAGSLCAGSVCAQSLQMCPTLSDPMDCSLPGSSVHGILQARILEWVAMPSSKGSSRPRDRTQVSHVSCRFFTTSATWEVPNSLKF